MMAEPGATASTPTTLQMPTCIIDYEKLLKHQYQRMSILPSGDWPPSLGRQFVKLTIIERQERLPDTKMAESLGAAYIHGKIDKIAAREKVIDEVTDLYGREDSQVKVLLDGAPGIGKTTLSRKACKDWANGTKLQNYLLVVYLPLREKEIREAKSIEDLLDVGNPKLQEKVTQRLCETFGDKLLIIFDGFDELSPEDAIKPLILRIIEGKQLQKCSVLVTSRPYASDDLQELDCIDHHIEVVGFTQLQIRECIKQNIQDEEKATELLRLLQEKSDITSLCYTPLNTTIMLYVYKQDKCLPNTLTKLFEMFILNALKRHFKQNDTKLHKRIGSLSTLPLPLNKQLDALSTIAYQGLLAGVLIFQEEELDSAFLCCPYSDLESKLLGLMTAVKCYSGTGEETNYQFLHLNIQEFLAARHAVAHFTKTEQTEFIRKQLKNVHLKMVLLFIVGMSPPSFDAWMHIFMSRSIDLPRYPSINATRESLSRNAHPRSPNYTSCHKNITLVESANPRSVSLASRRSVTLAGTKSTPKAPNLRLKKLRHISSGDYSINIQMLLLLLQLINESQNSDLFHILMSTLPNQEELPFQFHRLTPSDCMVLGQFLCQTKHSWENLEFHFCGLTDQSIEAFHRASSGSPSKACRIKSLTLSYNMPSLISALSLLPTISWLKCTNQVILQGIQYPQGTPADQIQLHSLLDLESLTDLKLQVERIPESHISDYSVVLNKFMAKVVHKQKLRKLAYNGPYPPHCEATLARLFEHRMSADTPLQQLELTLLGLGKVHVETSNQCYFKLELGGEHTTCTAEECQQFFEALNECHIEHQKLLLRGLTNTIPHQFAAGIVENTEKTLDVSWNNISSAIFTSLEHITSLEELDLSGNKRLAAGDNEAVGCAVERMLRVNKTLKVLKLSEWCLTDVVKHIVAGLSQNRSLELLEISHSTISVAGFANILRVLEHVHIAEAVDTHTMSEWKLHFSISPICVTGVGEVSFKDHELNIEAHEGTTTAKSFLHFFMALNHTTLSYPKLSVRGLTYQTAKHFSAGLVENRSVKVLNIRCNNISSTIFRSLEYNTSLEELDMSWNKQLIVGNSKAVGYALERMLRVNTTLKVLKMDHCGLDNTVMMHITCGLEHNTALAELIIGDSATEVYVLLFKALHHNSSLRKLNISGGILRMADSEALAEMLSYNKSLNELDVGQCNDYVDLFKVLHHNSSLRKLNTSGSILGTADSEALAGMLSYNKSLTELDVGRCSGCVDLFKALHHNSSLRKLNISGSILKMADSEALAEMLSYNKSLTELDVGRCSSYVHLFKVLHHNSLLRKLNISGSILKMADSEALAEMLSYNNSLTELDVGWCKGCIHLFNALHHNSSLRKLNIRWSELEMADSEALAEMLSHNKSLTELDVRWSKSYVHLFKALHHNSCLRKLDISGSVLKMADSEDLAEMLSYNKSLTELDVRWCDFPEDGLRVVARGLLHNTTLQTLRINDWLYNKTFLEREIERLRRAENIDTSQWKLRITEEKKD